MCVLAREQYSRVSTVSDKDKHFIELVFVATYCI